MQQLSIWETETFYAPQDIVIVGAGFTGLWTAFHLRQKYPSKKITVIEAGATPNGASARNAGFACFGSLTEILSDIENMGIEKAMKLISWRFEGLKTIRQYFNDSAIDYYHYGGYELTGNTVAIDKITEINNLLYNITQATETFIIEDRLINKFGFGKITHIIENRFEGALHPGKLLVALLQKTAAMNIQVMFGTTLKHFEEQPNGVLMHTADQRRLYTQQLIFCTNAFTKSLLPDMALVPARGQVLLTEPIPDLPFKGVFHYDEGYYYFRNFNNCILLGGARNTSFETEYTLDAFTTLPIQQTLERFLTEVILPNQKPAITHRWAGIMAMGPEKFPVIQKLGERSYCAVRLGGMGIALAPTIGSILAEMV
ncbi:MAG: FAD-dependent oxidoreductase [Niabella sp.]